MSAHADFLSLQLCLDKAVYLSVQDGVDIAFFVVGAVVFDHFVGLEDVGADLIAPAHLDGLSFELIEFGYLLFFGKVDQFGGEDFHGAVFVLQLGALGLAGYNEAGGDVGNADGAGDFVDVLATCSA